jgi:hypothetical protein
MRILLLLLMSFGVYADNEIYIDQTGNNVNIDIEQLGSSNLIGGLSSTSGSLTAAILNGGTWTFDINQIGSSNKFLTDGIYGDNFTGFFEFDGDSNEFEFSMDTTGLNSADFADIYVDVTGGSSTFDWDIAQSSGADYLDLDFILDGDSGDFTFDIDSDYYTAYIDIFGDSNTLTLTKSGYGVSSSDAGYFYLDLDGSTNTIDITQSSTLAADYLKIESDASNSNICVIQNDGGTSTSC